MTNKADLDAAIAKLKADLIDAGHELVDVCHAFGEHAVVVSTAPVPNPPETAPADTVSTPGAPGAASTAAPAAEGANTGTPGEVA